MSQSSFYDENNNAVGADAHPSEGTVQASGAAASQPSPSNASVWFEELSGTSGPRSHRRVSLQGELFHGVVEASKHGTHPVIRYPIPGGPLCYVFEYQRRTTQGQVVYRCIGCKRNQRTTSVAVLNGSDLVGDPALLPHVCLPRKNAQDRVTRLVYKSCQEIAKDGRLVNARPRELWQNMAEQVHYQEGTSEAERNEMLHYFHRNGYEARRKTVARAVARLHDYQVNMENVPRQYAFLPDGTPFLQHFTPQVHIYYSAAILEKACQLGLTALVADGVHDLQPDATNKTGQLYTVHGVMANSVDIRLLFAITIGKSEEVYDVIFGTLRDAIARVGGPQQLRILLDFENAAINAAKRCFPSASVEGCAFHLAQAWNRKRDALGLRPQVKGSQRSRRVKRWWRTIKGLIFLPKELHRRVPALLRPPVPRGHAAHLKCCMFLEYLRDNWYRGPFRNMWNKWNVLELRTTNIAESYHRQLGRRFREKYPRMSDLLFALRGYVTTARGDLLNIERRREEKRLNKKDILRRRRIEEEMSRFATILEQSGNLPSEEDITEFCRRMSRFVTEKVV